MRPRYLTALRPAKHCRQLLVGWKPVDGVPHGLLTMEIHHSKTEVESYRLQQVPKQFFNRLLFEPNPEGTMNQLLRMYLPEG
ncbi:MAG TPA: hypothetical protein VN666_21735 [Nitrospira sp.]|nr:hypothetical protein [Nitrospira sp.]